MWKSINYARLLNRDILVSRMDIFELNFKRRTIHGGQKMHLYNATQEASRFKYLIYTILIHQKLKDSSDLK